MAQANNKDRDLLWKKKETEVNNALKEMYNYLSKNSFGEFAIKYMHDHPLQKKRLNSKQGQDAKKFVLAFLTEAIDENPELKKGFLEAIVALQKAPKAFNKYGNVVVILEEELQMLVKVKGKWKMVIKLNNKTSESKKKPDRKKK